MIPDNISKEAILKAFMEIDINGIPKARESIKFLLNYEGRFYPPKYVISLANKYVNGFELDSSNFSGGKETNDFLSNLGFQIKGPDYNKQDVIKKDQKENSGLGNLSIATTIIQSDGNHTNDNRFNLLFKIIRELDDNIDLILLPAGFLITNRKADTLYRKTVEKISNKINLKPKNITVCLGIDGRDGKDQIALAIDNKGLVALGRKFHPTAYEVDNIDIASTYLSSENGYSRIFKIRGKKIYLAVCYDGFGIKQKKLKNPGVDLIFDLVHGFHPKGEGNSGDVYFAKHGFAGSSKEWKCPTFGSAIYFNRDLPTRWPTGVLWNQGDKNTSTWKYHENALKTVKDFEVSNGVERALIKVYEV